MAEHDADRVRAVEATHRGLEIDDGATGEDAADITAAVRLGIHLAVEAGIESGVPAQTPSEHVDGADALAEARLLDRVTDDIENLPAFVDAAQDELLVVALPIRTRRAGQDENVERRFVEKHHETERRRRPVDVAMDAALEHEERVLVLAGLEGEHAADLEAEAIDQLDRADAAIVRERVDRVVFPRDREKTFGDIDSVPIGALLGATADEVGQLGVVTALGDDFLLESKAVAVARMQLGPIAAGTPAPDVRRERIAQGRDGRFALDGVREHRRDEESGEHQNAANFQHGRGLNAVRRYGQFPSILSKKRHKSEPSSGQRRMNSSMISSRSLSGTPSDAKSVMTAESKPQGSSQVQGVRPVDRFKAMP